MEWPVSWLTFKKLLSVSLVLLLLVCLLLAVAFLLELRSRP